MADPIFPPLLPPIPDEEFEDLLKIKTVKQLPQSPQVPTMYNVRFQYNSIVDTNLVIKAIRQDMETLRETLVDPINVALTNQNEVIEALEAERLLLTDRVTALEALVASYHP